MKVTIDGTTVSCDFVTSDFAKAKIFADLWASGDAVIFASVTPEITTPSSDAYYVVIGTGNVNAWYQSLHNLPTVEPIYAPGFA